MKYGNFFGGALGTLVVLLVAGCDKMVEGKEDVPAGHISLEEVAAVLSGIPLGPEQMAEVREATGTSAGNGYDEEYRMKDLFAAPGCGVGEDAATKAGSYSRPLRDLLREAVLAGQTKVAAMDPEAWLDSLAASDVQIYWPFSASWDGETLPVITYDPGDNAEENEGFLLKADGSIEKVLVDEETARERPVWVVNRNSDADYKSLELQRREDPSWGSGGGEIIVHPQTTKATDDARTLILRSFKVKRQFDSWLSGGSEFWIRCAGVDDYTVSTEAEMRIYEPRITDFMIVVRRNQVGEELDVNTVLVSDWVEEMESGALMIVEDDGGTRTSWKASAVVKYNSKAYGVEVEFPINTRDDIVWRGALSCSFIEKALRKEKAADRWIGLGEAEILLDFI